jgi:hypothetical protein
MINHGCHVFAIMTFHNANVHGHDLEIEMWSQDVYA